ncbi:SusC/RagA family TonB-linked outer membrane protein [Labilibaculum euxinus]|uniref:SusC/RagA family TonB-linked outer membrane protein n=1 Tax=Labilibaculum euxinus TaxID=2686357 RepID=A0A7M4D531_9BACT|nr:TonB-dependent receptor [Labilibaculum euxinus]MUP37760.1 SusC/RagA family TonB-linked outer membrane protein [Labilibaculum euxinus]MVB06965.1 SusC/RagA family TonB-linked outer membrane protein [Labilibaculum euxinus]
MTNFSKVKQKQLCPICFRIGVLVLLFCSTSSVFAQDITVSGKVIDVQTKESIPGTNVFVKGTTIGTITNIDGAYKLEASSEAILVFSFIGYESQEIPLKGKRILNVSLEVDSEQLDEVVAIGYGTVKKRDLTGAVSSVQGKALANIPVSSVAQALTGRLAGVQITTADGSPDAEMIIRVRGGGSVTGDNSPLYIVDGFPVSSMSDVSSNDIETIDVLKDASSTAIYGSQGANGVVIITTKSAKAGKTQVSYNGFFQTKKLRNRLDVLDPHEYVMRNYELAALGGEDDLKNFENKFGVFDDLDLYKFQKGTNWQDDMFGADVLSQQHNISITGGNEKTKFSLSTSYNHDGGLMKDNDYTRYYLNLKVNHKLADNLKFNANVRVSDGRTNGSGTSGGSYKVRTSDAVTKGPVNGLQEFIQINPGTLTDDEYAEWIKSNLTLSERAAQYWKRKYNKKYSFTGALTWEIIKGLTYRLDGGYTIGFKETQNYWGQYTSNASYVGGKPLVDWTKSTAKNYREVQTLAYNFNINTLHNFNIMLGQELVSGQGDESNIYATGYSTDLTPDKIFANLGLGEGIPKVASAVYDNDNLESFFGRIGYNYNEKYLLTVTARADGSSKFPSKNHWGIFPAAAFAWRITQEPFMESTENWLSNLKLRVSYGEVGNNRIKSTMYKQNYSIQDSKAYGIGDKFSGYYGAKNKQLANPNLKWETTVTRNIGLDFGFFNEKLSGTLEAYNNSSKDLLIERSIVAPGYETTVENVGAISNKGIELSLNATIINKKDFTLSTNFNIGFNKSNVDKLADGISEQVYSSGWAGTDNKGNDDYRVRVGEPVGLIYGWVTDGYYTTDDFVSYDESSEQYVLKDGVAGTGLLGGVIGVRPGTIKLKDLDNSGTVDREDRKVIGNTNPDFTGGFSMNAMYHGFDASVMFSFVYGNDIYNANKIASTQKYRTNDANLLAIMDAENSYSYLNRETGEVVTDLQTLKTMNEGNNKKELWSPYSFGNAVVLPHSWAVEDGSFLRLQNITLGYTLPEAISQRVSCSRFRVYCTVNNLWTWTNYTGYDPEVSSPVRSSSTSGLTPGVDYSSYPKSLSWTFGVNVTF